MTLKEICDDLSMLKVILLHDLFLLKRGRELFKIAPLDKDEGRLLRSMHRLRRLKIDKNTEDLDRVIETFTKDQRALIMRMAHRLNDVRKLERLPFSLRNEVARESLHMYSAIAGRLGFNSWRYEMEDLCFRHLYPKVALNLKNQFDRKKQLDQTCLKHTISFLKKNFKKQNIGVKFEYRIKSLYSTYRKMLLKGRTFEELTDRLAIRIITDSVEDCYKALGVVHGLMHPIPGKLKDYIGAPKENGYRSIHTVVYPLPGVTEQPIEIQIRSQEIHRECEYGVLAHGTYKNARYVLHNKLSRVDLFRNLEILRRESRSPQQFKKAMRSYFQDDFIMIFDHKNNLYNFKRPVTAMDFAFIVYKSRCRRLKEIKVNGRVQSLDTFLHDGDVVEVKFGRKVSFDRKWRGICYRPSAQEVARELTH